jgi:hypothetical protein
LFLLLLHSPAAFGELKGFGMARLLWTEGRSLYAGAGATMLRNAPGSFALFGGAELAYQYAFHLRDRREASVSQHLAASVLGSVASIAVSSPLDTIKTRIQMQNFGAANQVGGMNVFRELVRHEGITALWKGLTPKILIVGPKLCFRSATNHLLETLSFWPPRSFCRAVEATVLISLSVLFICFLFLLCSA